jgi:ABC-type glycerol-3-phosphate transport system permease component
MRWRVEVRKRLDLGHILIYAFMLVIVIGCFFPILWMITNSFRTTNELYMKPLGIPQKFDFSVFVRAWGKAHFDYAIIP